MSSLSSVSQWYLEIGRFCVVLRLSDYAVVLVGVTVCQAVGLSVLSFCRYVCPWGCWYVGMLVGRSSCLSVAQSEQNYNVHKKRLPTTYFSPTTSIALADATGRLVDRTKLLLLCISNTCKDLEIYKETHMTRSMALMLLAVSFFCGNIMLEDGASRSTGVFPGPAALCTLGCLRGSELKMYTPTFFL